MNSITGKALVWNHVLNFSGEDGLGGCSSLQFGRW